MSEPKPAIQELADALQHCLNEAAERGADRAVEKLSPRLDRQDATLRLMWKQMKRNGSLPIDT